MNPLIRPFEVQVRAEGAGLSVVRLAVGGRVRFPTGADEMLVLPLTGGCDVACDDERMTLTGRRSVFSRVTDFVYLPRGTTATLRAPNGGRFALPAARTDRDLPFRYGAAEDVPVESGDCRVNHLCAPESFETGRLTVREVLIPGGLRCAHGTGEIRYFETTGSGYQWVSGRRIEVRTGDVVLIPPDGTGPSVAARGHDLYHLTVSMSDTR